MNRLIYVVLFVFTIIIVVSFRAFSNPNQSLPECFVQGQGGQIQDLTDLCGGSNTTPKTAPSIPNSSKPPAKAPITPPEKISNPYNKTHNGATVNLPSTWKVFPDGSISPSPGILVPSLYDIN